MLLEGLDQWGGIVCCRGRYHQPNLSKVVRYENEDTWSWFINLLKLDLVGLR